MYFLCDLLKIYLRIISEFINIKRQLLEKLTDLFLNLIRVIKNKQRDSVRFVSDFMFKQKPCLCK